MRAFLLVLSLLPFSATAVEIDVGNTQCTVDADGALQSCNQCPTNGHIVIPESVTSIGEKAFYKCGGITSATFPAGLTSIGKQAFDKSGLTYMYLPATTQLTSIGEKAFLECKSLLSVIFPPKLTTIGKQAFSKSGLSLLDFSQATQLTTIGEKAFLECKSLLSVTFPPTLTTIGSKAFEGSSLLRKVAFPATLTTIEHRAFYRSGLVWIDFSQVEDITSLTIESEAFKSNNDLLAVTYAGDGRPASNTPACDAPCAVNPTQAEIEAAIGLGLAREETASQIVFFGIGEIPSYTYFLAVVASQIEGLAEGSKGWNDADALAARHAELVVQRVDAACGLE